MTTQLLQDFKKFLFNQGSTKATAKNYLNDIKHFLSWLKFTLKSHRIPFDENSPVSLIEKVNQETVATYKQFLISNKVIITTANRKFSSLRKFCKFCVSQRWLTENPAKKVGNIMQKTQTPWKNTLNKFARSLEKEGAKKATVKNYLADIKLFLTWVESVT